MIALDTPPPITEKEALQQLRDWAARCPGSKVEADEQAMLRALRTVRRWAQLDREGYPPDAESGDHGLSGRH